MMDRGVMQRQMFAKGGAAGFPDLNKDGNVTYADILQGRGVKMQEGGESMDAIATEAKRLGITVSELLQIMAQQQKSPTREPAQPGVPSPPRRPVGMQMGGEPMAAQQALMQGEIAPPPMQMADPAQAAGVPMDQASAEAAEMGIDPNVVEQMLSQLSEGYGDIDNAETYEQVMNMMRGDNAPIEERRDELADLVGPEDAAATPESVLTLVQPIMQMAVIDQGIGGLAQEEMNTPIEGNMAGGIMSTVDMGAEEAPVPVNFNQGGAVQYMAPGGVAGTPDPRALQLFEQDKALYNQLLGSGDQQAAYDEQKKMTQAQMLFDIAQGALAFATPGDRQMSPAERLAEVAQPVLGNIGVRSGELLKFKQGQAAEKRALDLAALQSSQTKLGVEKQASIDAAAASALAESKLVEQNAKRAQELLLQGNKFSFEKKQNETEQVYAVRLANDLAESKLVLENLKGELTTDQIELRKRLEEKAARLSEAHDLVLQGKKFDFTTKERLSSQVFKSELQNAIDSATASRQALGFANDAKTIAQRGELDKELAALRSELRITEKAVDLDNTLEIAGVKNGYELAQMDKGHGFNVALADHKGTISAAAAQNQQLATAAENALDRAAREGLQINAQNFKQLLQDDMQDFTGSEAEKDRLLTQLQNEVMNTLKERGLDISQGNLDLATLTQAASESLALRKQAFEEAEAKADRLAPSLKVINDDLVLFNPADNSATSVFKAEGAPTKPIFKVIRDMNNQTTRVVDVTTAPGLAAVEAANQANVGGTQMFTVSNMGADSAPTAKAFAIQGLGNVLSYDGGRTYLDASGQSVSMPTTGVNPLSDTIAYDIAAKQRIALTAGKDLDLMDEQLGIISKGGTRENPTSLSSEEAGLMRDAMASARGGTGPYAGFAVFLDNVFGGLIPLARKSFQDTQANRQFLRGLTILGRSALVVNPRFPVAEMEKVGALFPDPDRFIVDPESEANKFITLKQLATQQKRANLQALSDGIQDDKTRQAVQANNFEINRLLGMLATVPSSVEGNVDSDTLEGLRNFIKTQQNSGQQIGG